MSNLLFVPIIQAFQANVAVSGDTVRWTYTVPNGKRAVVEYIKCRVLESVATALGAAYIRIVLFGANGTINNVIGVLSANALADRAIYFACCIDLLSGDVVQCTSGNAGAGPLFMESALIVKEYG